MKNALIVDDSRAIRNILARILTHEGLNVAEATNGLEGLRVLEEDTEFALICADWNMPEMNGLEFLTRVRADSRFASISVLMITTETHMERVTQALEAGASEYLMKPFTAGMVTDKLKFLGILPQG